MSINKYISSLPDTKRTFDNPENDFALYQGLFVHNENVSFPDEDSFIDYEDYITFLESGDLIPLHFIKEFENRSEETTYLESIQDYSYKGRDGRTRHAYKYVWSLDYHQIVEQLDGTNYYIIRIDKNWNVHGVLDELPSGETGIRGFKTNRIILEKLAEADANNPAFSVLDIEYPDETGTRVSKKLNWNPEDVDRLFMSVNVEYADATTLNFSARYRGETVTGIVKNDVTLIDDINGDLQPDVVDLLGGIYRCSNFTSPLTGGQLRIISSLYLGCAIYRITTAVSVATNFDFEDGINYEFEDAVNFDFET